MYAIASLDRASTREKVTERVVQALQRVVAGETIAAEGRKESCKCGTEEWGMAALAGLFTRVCVAWLLATTKLLATCRALMRDRRGIHLLLTTEVPRV